MSKHKRRTKRRGIPQPGPLRRSVSQPKASVKRFLRASQETLERLRHELGAKRPIVLLLGTDAFRNLSSWERWRDLFPLAHVLVAQRPGHSLTLGGMPAALAAEWRKRAGTPDVLRERPGGNVVTYGTTALDISASAIRAHFAQARSPRYLLPSAVLDYIEAHGLYAQSSGAP